MNNSDRSPLGLYTIGIAALFLAGFLLLVVFGAQSYRRTVAGQNRNMDTRALLSYLTTSVKANDVRDAVSVEEGEDGSVLTLADARSGYALRIYRHGDELVEDYAPADAPLDPEEAQVIGTTRLFRAELADGDTLRLATDAGEVLVHLRSEGGGEP